MEKKAKLNCNITKKDEVRSKNLETIVSFFSLYLKDRKAFYDLWVADEPVIVLPFTTEGVAVCKQADLVGWDAVKSFWDPIFDMTGTFDWEIDDVFFGEDPNVIITKSRSNIDVDTTEAFNNVHLNYQGKYIQIFKFEAGKVKQFEEYYDTAFLNEQYK